MYLIHRCIEMKQIELVCEYFYFLKKKNYANVKSTCRKTWVFKKNDISSVKKILTPSFLSSGTQKYQTMAYYHTHAILLSPSTTTTFSNNFQFQNKIIFFILSSLCLEGQYHNTKWHARNFACIYKVIHVHTCNFNILLFSSFVFY